MKWPWFSDSDGLALRAHVQKLEEELARLAVEDDGRDQRLREEIGRLADRIDGCERDARQRADVLRKLEAATRAHREDAERQATNSELLQDNAFRLRRLELQGRVDLEEMRRTVLALAERIEAHRRQEPIRSDLAASA